MASIIIGLDLQHTSGKGRKEERELFYTLTILKSSPNHNNPPLQKQSKSKPFVGFRDGGVCFKSAGLLDSWLQD